MLSVAMYEDLKEYLNWYDTRRDTKFAADAPVIGLVLQRSHLVTGDEGHYSGVVSELEAQGAKVLPLFFLSFALLLFIFSYSKAIHLALIQPSSVTLSNSLPLCTICNASQGAKESYRGKACLQAVSEFRHESFLTKAPLQVIGTNTLRPAVLQHHRIAVRVLVLCSMLLTPAASTEPSLVNPATVSQLHAVGPC